MEEQVLQKPTSVTVIGVFLILASVFTILSTLFGLLIIEDIDSSLLLYSPAVTFALNLFSILYYIALLVVSVQFLKLKEWARRTTEVFTWIYIFWTILFTIYGFNDVQQHMIKTFENFGLQLSSTLATLLVGFQVSILVFTLAIASAILIYLRSKTVRNAMIH